MAGRLVVNEGVSPPGWDDQLRAVGGTIFHCSAWAEYVAAEQRNVTPLFLQLVEHDARPLAFALAFHERSRRRLLAAFSGRVWLDSRPVAVGEDDAAAERTMLERVEGLARQLGAVKLSVGSYASPDRPPALEALGYTPARRFEFEFDLRRSDAVLLQAMGDGRRRGLAKARRSGVTVVDLDTETGLREMRRLEAVASARVVQRGGPRFGYTGDPAGDPVRVLLARGVGRLVGAVVDGQLVSVDLFTRFGSLIYSTHGGHDARALETRASSLVFWEVLRRSRDEGAERFSLGGCSAAAVREDSSEHGVYEYKKAFGATCLPCTSGEKVLRPVTQRVMATLHRLARRTG